MYSSSNCNRRQATPPFPAVGRQLRWSALVLLSILTACSGAGPAEDPDWTAVARADLEAAGNDPEVVSCVLDLAARDLERGPLGELGSQEAVRHCRTAHLAVTETDAAEFPDTELAMSDLPWGFGDDAELDALWVRCQEGEGSACDELFERSVVGSIYEDFGVSCGNRPDVVDCQELDQPDPDGDRSES